MSNDSGKRKENISQLIRHIESQVEGGMRAGVDLYEIVDMITGARMMLDAGLIEDAEKLANQAFHLVGVQVMQFDRLSNFIRQGRRQINSLVESGTYTGDATIMLEKAEEAMANSDYELGIGYAMKCIESIRDEVKERRPKSQAGN